MISIIIPAYNVASFIMKTLAALEGQTYKNFEVIVVNDGSTDNTRQILEQYHRLSPPFPLSIIHQERKGANIARNNGVKFARGNYLLFLDADKILAPIALQKFLETLHQYPNATYAYCNFYRDGKKYSPQAFDREKLINGELLIDTCSLIRRDKFPKRGFDPRVRRLQDWDLWLTMLEEGNEGVFINEYLFETFSRPTDITSTEDLGQANNFIREKHKSKMGLLKELVDIIILRFGNSPYDEECIGAIFENTDYPYYQITLFDNYYPRFTLSKIWNMLIRRSLGEYICLLNNDTRPEKGWLKKLIEVFKREKNVGAVGPTTNQCQNPQKANPSDKYEIVDFEKEYGKTFQLSGFCLVFPKYIWEEVGGFDERFGLYAQENEFLHRVQERGYKTYWRKDAFVWHKGGATAKKLEKKEGLNIEEERGAGNELYQKILRGEL